MQSRTAMNATHHKFITFFTAVTKYLTTSSLSKEELFSWLTIRGDTLHHGGEGVTGNSGKPAGHIASTDRKQKVNRK